MAAGLVNLANIADEAKVSGGGGEGGGEGWMSWMKAVTAPAMAPAMPASAVIVLKMELIEQPFFDDAVLLLPEPLEGAGGGGVAVICCDAIWDWSVLTDIFFSPDPLLRSFLPLATKK